MKRGEYSMEKWTILGKKVENNLENFIIKKNIYPLRFRAKEEEGEEVREEEHRQQLHRQKKTLPQQRRYGALSSVVTKQSNLTRNLFNVFS